MRALFTGCCLLIFLSCNNRQGAEKGVILKPDKMQAVMWDMFKADAFTDRYLKPDSTKKVAEENAALQQKIFDIHKITRNDYYLSYHYYTTQPEMMRAILDSISIKAERERSSLMESRYSGSHAKE
jgi:hypothetical protein